MKKLNQLFCHSILIGMLILTPGFAKNIHVDARRGNDQNPGTRQAPLRTIHEAVSRLPDKLDGPVGTMIYVYPGRYQQVDIEDRQHAVLELNRSMSVNQMVLIRGVGLDGHVPAKLGEVIFDWQPESKPGLSGFFIDVRNGNWRLENIQVGTRREGNRLGINVTGPGQVHLENISVRTSSKQGAGLMAQHNGQMYLYGFIGLNEDVKTGENRDKTFASIRAEYGGLIKCRPKKGSSLVLGNGNLTVTYYGMIELGCETASISSWHYQANPIAANNSGRVDLHNTTTTLTAHNSRNTPIGLEHDGHVLAEGAHIIIEGKNNNNAIVLQKSSTLFCNDVEIRGNVKQDLMAYSDSTLLVGILGDLDGVRATTGATVIVEKCTGAIGGALRADSLGKVVLPDGREISSSNKTGMAKEKLPDIHQAALDGLAGKVKSLLDSGVDVNLEGPNKMTPLHMAAMGGHRGMATLLLEHGAKIKAKDSNDAMPVDLAQSYGHNAMAEFLKSKMP